MEVISTILPFFPFLRVDKTVMTKVGTQLLVRFLASSYRKMKSPFRSTTNQSQQLNELHELIKIKRFLLY